MTETKLALTENDYRKLYSLASGLGKSSKSRTVSSLLENLKHALVFKDEEISSAVVTMNSRIKLSDPEDGEQYAYELVFPSDADISKGMLSVLTPLGAALIGRREGEVFNYESPGGLVSIRVDSVEYQPEKDEE